MLTSAVLGTDSQKTSILMSPAVVCNVTDMAGDRQSRCSAHDHDGIFEEVKLPCSK